MIRVVCGCGRVFKAEDRHSGKRTRCPICGTGLTIGQTPTSSTSEGDLDEVPSWWFPADAGLSDDSSTDIPKSGDPDTIRTEVLPPPTPHLDVQNEPEGNLCATTPMARPHPDEPRGRRVTPRAGAIAITVILATVAYWSIQPAFQDGHGPAAPNQPAVDRDDSRGANGANRAGRMPPPGDRQAASEVPAEPKPRSRRLRLLVPAYIYPAGENLKQWRRLIDASAKVDLIVVVNPHSGPGLERNPDYAAAVAEAASRGVKLVGYIDLEFGDRQVNKIKADIDAWRRFYPLISGFFLDRQPCDAAHAAYVLEVSSYAREKQPGALLIGDPGQPCDDSFFTRRAIDVACIFARPEGFATFELPANLRSLPASQFAALAYQVPDAQAMQALLKEAIIKRIGYIFVTNGKSPNPWGSLPAYWEDEIEFVSKVH